MIPETPNEKDVNQKLRNLYAERRASIIPPELGLELSAPLLLKIGGKWMNSSNRILIIGQETQCWGYDPITKYLDFDQSESSIDELMNAYERFCFAKSSSHRRSPFWRAYRQIRKIIPGNEQFDTNIIWTNIVRAAYNGRSIFSASSNVQNVTLEAFKGWLTREIDILEPHKIIFLTGPKYDKLITSEFGEVDFKASGKTYSSRELSKFNIKGVDAYRTYHPAYLQRANKWGIVAEIESIIS